ncbi:MAG TPA: extracellular solute-binding protein [Xanthobacteraceae bacterium]|nr:extracellular solute-binding protein [Xanthobacteraceae bacterium]
MKRFLATAVLALTLPALAAAQTADNKSWEQTLAAARAEGKLVMSGPPSAELRRTLPAAFEKRYGIPIEYIGGRTSELTGKLRAERAAGIYSLDVAMAGIQSLALVFYREKMLQPLRPMLVLPEVTDGSKWKRGSLWFSDPDDKFILRISNSVTTMFHINTTKVKQEDLRTAKDLLDPKWKGKIALQDPTTSGSGGNQAAHLYYQLGEDFVKKLYVDQAPMISRDTRQITDWLARGTTPIALGADDAEVDRLRKEGMPIALLHQFPDLYTEVSAGFGQVAVLDKPPHPNAAKVFVNWIASKEGGEVYARAMDVAPTRNDIDESFLPPEIIPQAGAKYFDTFDWEFTVTKKEFVRKYMRQLLRQ